MAGKARPVSALRALLIALPIGLILAWSLPTQGPSRAELAQAITARDGGAVSARDLRDLQCGNAVGGGYACRWMQREGDAWQARAGHVHVSAEGWRLTAR